MKLKKNGTWAMATNKTEVLMGSITGRIFPGGGE